MGEEKISKKYAGMTVSKGVTNSRYLLGNLVDFLDILGAGTYPKAFSLGTLRAKDKAKQVIRLMELCEELDYKEEYIEWRQEADLLVINIMDELDSIAPKGTYFGAHEGDGALFGFWPIDRNAAIEFGFIPEDNFNKKESKVA